MTRDARGRHSAVIEDFRRKIVTRGADARGPFVILECQHKHRKRAENPTDTARWCNSCANRSPYR
jgi:hypothetical protein